MNTLHLDKARIVGLEIKTSKGAGSITSAIRVTAAFTAKVATALDARYLLFDKEQLVKDGFKSVELDCEIKNIQVKFEVLNLGNPLELISESATAFKVLRRGDGKKKAKKLLVQFRIQHAGSPFELLEHMLRVGGTEGALTITPLQVEMFDGKLGKEIVDRPFAEELDPLTRIATLIEDGLAMNTPWKKLYLEELQSLDMQPVISEDQINRLNDAGLVEGDAVEWRTADEIAAGVPVDSVSFDSNVAFQQAVTDTLERRSRRSRHGSSVR